jgi:hypothetical protein
MDGAGKRPSEAAAEFQLSTLILIMATARLTAAVQVVWTNSPDVRDKCVETVRTLLGNVIQHPTEAKYRRIRLVNAR